MTQQDKQKVKYVISTPLRDGLPLRSNQPPLIVQYWLCIVMHSQCILPHVDRQSILSPNSWKTSTSNSMPYKPVPSKSHRASWNTALLWCQASPAFPLTKGATCMLLHPYIILMLRPCWLECQLKSYVCDPNIMPKCKWRTWANTYQQLRSSSVENPWNKTNF